MRNTEKEREESKATERLREWIKPGDTLYTVLRHRSRSGMSRSISVLGLQQINNLPQDKIQIWSYDGNVALATGRKFDRDREGVKVQGCGMDMGFHLVYTLSRILFPKGFGCVGEGCPSNDHVNGDRDYTPHATVTERTGADGTLCTCHKEHWHRDGGYAVRQRWI